MFLSFFKNKLWRMNVERYSSAFCFSPRGQTFFFFFSRSFSSNLELCVPVFILFFIVCCERAGSEGLRLSQRSRTCVLDRLLLSTHPEFTVHVGSNTCAMIKVMNDHSILFFTLRFLVFFSYHDPFKFPCPVTDDVNNWSR